MGKAKLYKELLDLSDSTMTRYMASGNTVLLDSFNLTEVDYEFATYYYIGTGR